MYNVMYNVMYYNVCIMYNVNYYSLRPTGDHHTLKLLNRAIHMWSAFTHRKLSSLLCRTLTYKVIVDMGDEASDKSCYAKCLR